jgi:hypothetical protein
VRKWWLAALACLPATAYAQQPSGGVGPIAIQALGASQQLKTLPGNLFSLNVVSGGTAGYILLLDSKTIPADGAVTPVKCMPLAANTGIDLNWSIQPVRFVNGIAIVFSSTGCFTKTASATAFISGSAQ